jgi:PKD repeat protein
VTNVCTSNVSTNQQVTVNPLVSANFTDNATSQCGQIPVGFTDTSTGTPMSWLWEYARDGGNWTQFSTDQNPVQIFAIPGQYSIRLTVSNGCGSDIYTRLNDFTVYQVPNASFSGAPTLGDAPLGVNFIDSSLGSPIQWNWTFGDGGTSSMQNPSHTYLTVGTYNVASQQHFIVCCWRWKQFNHT